MQKYKTVPEFLNDLDADKKSQVEALRKIILANSKLDEHIKWNAPSYVLDGEDRVTFNLMNKQGIVKLVLHMGATRKEDKKAAPVMKDVSGLIDWSSDIRGVISFQNLEDVVKDKDIISELIQKWLLIS